MPIYVSNSSDSNLYNDFCRDKVNYQSNTNSVDRKSLNISEDNIIDLIPYLVNSSEQLIRKEPMKKKLKDIIGFWQGDDLKEMLDLVYATRSKF